MKHWILSIIRRLVATESLRQDLAAVRDSQLFRGVIEDCIWMKYKSFAPIGWALDNAALYTIFCVLDYVKPKNILEFGLGQSSKMLHQYVDAFHDANALTIEHDQKWIDFFLNSIPKDITIRYKRFDAELINYNGFETTSYNGIDAFLTAEGRRYDFVIADGYGSERYSRSYIASIVKNYINESFCIFIDDTGRTGEQDTIKISCEILSKNNIKYHLQNYGGSGKIHTIICSDDLKFLTYLR